MLSFNSRNVKLLAVTLTIFLIALLAGCNSDTKSGSTSGNKPSDKVDDQVAVLDTDMGRIVIELFPGDAPKHVENFKKLINDHFYDGTAFHRIIANNIIQGGDPNTKTGDPNTWGMGQPNQPTVPAEFNARKHERGIVSAARRGNDVNSATSQFFICEKPKPEWDNQYSVFGRVIEGMNVVDIISNAPTVENTERPIDKITIKKATLDKRANFGATPTYRNQE
jgi:cyclophilin family peptidyl-prolyl cis-trans isomerase